MIRRDWQGIWHGRAATQWTGMFKQLSQKIPYFEVRAFAIDHVSNKYKTLIVRKPLETDTKDYGELNIMPDDYIPIEAVSSHGYKLVQHHFLIDVFSDAFTHFQQYDREALQTLDATLKLSIYGARMQIEFSVPHYKRDPYILKLVCQNSVDRSMALTINLLLQHQQHPQKDIPFDGFHHPHTKELPDDAVKHFLENALRRFRQANWHTDDLDRDTAETLIDKNLTAEQAEAAWTLIDENIKQDRINMLRFREILAMLVDEGTHIFREQKLIRFAKLTNELNKLMDTDTEIPKNAHNPL